MKIKNHRIIQNMRWYLLFCLISALLLTAGCASVDRDHDNASDGTPAVDPQHEESLSKDAENADRVPEPDSETPPVTDAETDSYAEAIRVLLSGMSLEEKVGQMFLVRCPDTDGAGVISQYQFGGYILFARDFRDKTREQVRDDIRSYQEASHLPMLIGVDEEGGTVVRVSKYPEFRKYPFHSPRELLAEGGLTLVASDTVEKCTLLSSLGINLNLAPVCDLSDSASDFIYDRSAGGNAADVSDYVSCVVKTMNENNVGCVLKHFPGYGNNVDTHTGIAYDERPYETFEREDFLPFTAGIDAGAGAVLISHNVVKCMDGAMPASLSSAVHRILRETLAFEGVIMTDDLYMDAIQEYTGSEEAAVIAVLAGNDMLCCTDYEVQYKAVLEAVRAGTITVERVEESVERILRWKMSLGMLTF